MALTCRRTVRTEALVRAAIASDHRHGLPMQWAMPMAFHNLCSNPDEPSVIRRTDSLTLPSAAVRSWSLIRAGA